MNNFAKSFALGLSTVLSLPVFLFAGINAPAFVSSALNGHTFHAKTGLATTSTTQGNFNPKATLDTTQVTHGKTQDTEDQTMFCFDAKTDSGWDCFPYENIPSGDYYDTDSGHLVWAGPAKEIQSEYDRLN